MEVAGPLRVAVRIARTSSPAMANRATAVTSLLLIPLLEVVFLVAVSAAVGSAELVENAYAAVLVTLGLSVLGGTVGQVTHDRRLGVLQDALAVRFFRFSYWIAKMLVPVVLAAAVALVAAVGVFWLDPARDVALFGRALAVIPLCAIAGGLCGIGAATVSIALRDPYLVSNVAQGLLVITSGIVVPISAYPMWLSALGAWLPFTSAVELVRDDQGMAATGLVLRELVIALAWFGVGALVSRSVMKAIRSGRRTEEVW